MIRNHHSINGLFWFDTRDSFHLILIGFSGETARWNSIRLRFRTKNSFLAGIRDVRGTLKHTNYRLEFIRFRSSHITQLENEL